MTRLQPLARMILFGCLVTGALAGPVFPCFAQLTPSGKTICEMPQYRGTPIYNQYCGFGVVGRGQIFQPPPVDPNLTFVIERVVFSGEFFVITSDGRRLSGQNAAQVTINNGARIVTGPTGRAEITLPDDTTATFGPGSDVVLDSFFYDPNTNVRKVAMTIVIGFFRWVTGKVTDRTSYKPTIKLPVGELGPRGTDVECVVEPGGAGYIKLYSGVAELTDYDTAKVVVITAGQIVRFEDFKIIP